MPPELPHEAWLLATDLDGVPAPAGPWAGPGSPDAALADLRWLRASLRGLPKPPVPPGLLAGIHDALASPSVVPNGASELPLGVEDYLFGHDLEDLEAGEWEGLQAPFGDEASSRRTLAQLASLPELLRLASPTPPACPPQLMERIRGALAEEGPPAPVQAPRWPGLDEEEEGLPPAWAARWQAGDAPMGPGEALAHEELAFLQAALAGLAKPALPGDLLGRIHLALAEEPGLAGAPPPPPPGFLAGLHPKGAWWKRSSASALAGGMAAAFALWWGGALVADGNLPVIETAAVAVQSDVAVNIGFDVERDVEGVTFQIDLPEGLRFLDDKRQPLLAQSVSWRGSLKAGRTVVPIHVQGVRPGRFEIEAFVRKGSMMRKTTILLPVQGPGGGA